MVLAHDKFELALDVTRVLVNVPLQSTGLLGFKDAPCLAGSAASGTVLEQARDTAAGWDTDVASACFCRRPLAPCGRAQCGGRKQEGSQVPAALSQASGLDTSFSPSLEGLATATEAELSFTEMLEHSCLVDSSKRPGLQQR